MLANWLSGETEKNCTDGNKELAEGSSSLARRGSANGET